jgi:sugar phosphate isomerase/epimerase
MDKWWNKPLRVLQFNFEDKFGLRVSNITSRRLVELAKKMNINTLVIFFRDAFGYTYYHGSKVGKTRPGLSEDFVRRLVEYAHENGIRVVAMVAHTANKLVYMEHTDWAQVNHRGEPILLEHAPAAGSWDPEWPQLCLNSPYRRHMVSEVEEAVDIGADGILLDSLRYQPDPERACYCKWCRERFRREHGYEMATDPDWNNSVWRTLWDWRYRIVVETIEELRGVAKKRNRDILFMYNSHPGGWAGRANRVVELARDSLDAVFAECSEVDFEPPGFIAEMVKLTRAMLGFKGKVFASRNIFHSLKPPQPAPLLTIKQGLRETLMAGGDPWLLIFSSTLDSIDEELIDNISEVFKEHEKLEEYMSGAQPVRFAGIVISNIVRDHYGRLKPYLYVDETRGFFYALSHAHYPVEYVLDKDIARLYEEYKVLILADLACMSNEVLRVLQTKVSNGGGVVASNQTSFYDGHCMPAGGFLAADLLGVELLGEPITGDWFYLVKTTSHRLVEGIKSPVLVGEPRRNLLESHMLGNIVPVRPTKGFTAPLQVAFPGYRYGQEYTLGRSAPPLGYVSELAGAVVGSSTVYFPWRIGANYWLGGDPAIHSLILNAVKYVAGRPPINVNAPSTVISEAWRQQGRIIVHLLNYTTNQRILSAGFTGARQPIPGYSTSLPIHPVREIIPVPSVTVEVEASMLDGTDNVVAYSILKGARFEAKLKGGVFKVDIGVLGEYDVIVVESKS